MSLSFYEKAFENNYEELITYYPALYQQVYEMQEILKAQGKLADGVEAGIERAYLNNFIDYADAETIGNLEMFLKLGHNRTKEMEMRRRIIKAHFIGRGKISASLIKSMIQVYSGVNTIVEFDWKFCNKKSQCSQVLQIIILQDKHYTIPIIEVCNLLEHILPAHIMYVLYETYVISGYVKPVCLLQADEIFTLREVIA